MENKIDILELGKKEKIVKLFDPDNPDKFSQVRLVRMRKTDAEKAFKASQQILTDVREKLQKEEEEMSIFSNLVDKMDKKTKVEVLLSADRVDLENNSDLIEIEDERAIVEEMKQSGKTELEVDAYLDQLVNEKIDAKIEEKRKSIEKYDDKKLKDAVIKHIMEIQAQRESSDIFVERALCYMTYHEDKDERVFSDDPQNDMYVTNALRDMRIYGQLVGAYKDFLVTLRMTPKEIRSQAKRGGDFFTSPKSAEK